MSVIKRGGSIGFKHAKKYTVIEVRLGGSSLVPHRDKQKKRPFR